MIQPSTSVVRMFTRSPDFQVVRHEQYQEQERRRETLHEPDQTSAFMGEAKKIECEAITGKPAVSLRGLRGLRRALRLVVREGMRSMANEANENRRPQPWWAKLLEKVGLGSFIRR